MDFYYYSWVKQIYPVTYPSSTICFFNNKLCFAYSKLCFIRSISFYCSSAFSWEFLGFESRFDGCLKAIFQLVVLDCYYSFFFSYSLAKNAFFFSSFYYSFFFSSSYYCWALSALSYNLLNNKIISIVRIIWMNRDNLPCIDILLGILIGLIIINLRLS